MASSRIEHLRAKLDHVDLDALLVTNLLNVRYLSGFTGSYGYLLVTRDRVFLLTDSRYLEQAASESPDAQVVPISGSLIETAVNTINHAKPDRLGFEESEVNFRDWRFIKASIDSSTLEGTEGIVAELRAVKDEDEIAAIREAARLTDLACDHIVNMIEPGMDERMVAVEIDCFMRRCGAEKEAFDTIVASGPRSSLCHGKATLRHLVEGDLVVMDFGAKWNGYCGDITRTVVLGKPDAKQQEVYDVVLEAQTAAIAAIRPGLRGGDIDQIARDSMAKSGYSEFFCHGLGHGLGLEVHDARALGRGSETILKAGMVVTVEPGIYLPGWGGVRTEDDVLITETGVELLTHSPKIFSVG